MVPRRSWSPRSRPARPGWPSSARRRSSRRARSAPARTRYATTFLEFRGGADAGAAACARSTQLDPDVVVVFRPEIIPAGLLRRPARADRRLPHRAAAARRPCGAPRHEDLERRLWELGHVDRGELRPHRRLRPAHRRRPPTPSCRSGARCRCPSPTASTRPSARPRRGSARRLFVGRSTPHRERAADGRQAPASTSCTSPSASTPTQLQRGHGEPRGRRSTSTTSPTRASRTASACTSPPGTSSSPSRCSPTHGLEPGIDFLEITETPGQLARGPRAPAPPPDAWHRVRVRGRRKAEQFRASRVYPRLLADLEADLAAFGSPRAAGSGH